MELHASRIPGGAPPSGALVADAKAAGTVCKRWGMVAGWACPTFTKLEFQLKLQVKMLNKDFFDTFVIAQTVLAH